MKRFVDNHSIVRKIWGKSDTVLFIFAGAAAEFALNKAVDWLYFTGKLPSDPLARLFSTVGYAKKIIFSSEEEAHHAIDNLQKIHRSVEQGRGFSIPDWAYRDVLFMLIHYSISAYELLEQQLTPLEKDELYDVFYRLGTRMGLTALPSTYAEWQPVRHQHLLNDLEHSQFTAHLFQQYKKHLGPLRYTMMLVVQQMVVPGRVGKLLRFGNYPLRWAIIPVYKLIRKLKIDRPLKNLLLPPAYKAQIYELDVQPS